MYILPLHWILTSLLLASQPLQAIPDDLLKPPLKKEWKVNVGEQIHQQKLVGDRLYYSCFRRYGALDVRTGTILWQEELKDPPYDPDRPFDESEPIIAVGNFVLWENMMVVGISEVGLIAHDSATGKELWFLPGNPGSATAFGQGILYTQLDGETLDALDLGTRRIIWQKRFQSSTLDCRGSAGLMNECFLQNNRLVLETTDGTIHCLNAKTGDPIWKHGAMGQGHDLLMIDFQDEENVYFDAWSGDIGVLRSSDGKLLWKGKINGLAYGWVRTDQDILVLDSQAYWHALDPNSGTVRWEKRLSKHECSGCSAPSVIGDLLLAAFGSTIYAFDPHGQEQWNYDIEEELFEAWFYPQPPGILIVSSHAVRKFSPGKPTGPPESEAERAALARELASRYVSLNEDEWRMLNKLGPAAFEPLLPYLAISLRQSATAMERPTGNFEDRSTLYMQARHVFETLMAVMQPSHTPFLLALLKDSEFNKVMNARATALDLLSVKGDSRAVPLFLEDIERLGNEHPWEPLYTQMTVFFKRMDAPEINSFLHKALRNPHTGPYLKQFAFQSLPTKAGEQGIQAVLAARDKNRRIPPLRERLKLDGASGFSMGKDLGRHSGSRWRS